MNFRNLNVFWFIVCAIGAVVMLCFGCTMIVGLL